MESLGGKLDKAGRLLLFLLLCSSFVIAFPCNEKIGIVQTFESSGDSKLTAAYQLACNVTPVDPKSLKNASEIAEWTYEQYLVSRSFGEDLCSAVSGASCQPGRGKISIYTTLTSGGLYNVTNRTDLTNLLVEHKWVIKKVPLPLHYINKRKLNLKLVEFYKKHLQFKLNRDLVECIVAEGNWSNPKELFACWKCKGEICAKENASFRAFRLQHHFSRIDYSCIDSLNDTVRIRSVYIDLNSNITLWIHCPGSTKRIRLRLTDIKGSEFYSTELRITTFSDIEREVLKKLAHIESELNKTIVNKSAHAWLDFTEGTVNGVKYGKAKSSALPEISYSALFPESILNVTRDSRPMAFSNHSVSFTLNTLANTGVGPIEVTTLVKKLSPAGKETWIGVGVGSMAILTVLGFALVGGALFWFFRKREEVEEVRIAGAGYKSKDGEEKKEEHREGHTAKKKENETKHQHSKHTKHGRERHKKK